MRRIAGYLIVALFLCPGSIVTARLEAVFVRDELQATLNNGVKLVYRMRKEGDLEFMQLGTDGNWSVGILSKDPSR